MKILIFSDSHGNQTHMRRALELERPQAVFHLGDGRADILNVMQDWPETALYSVAGNCDWRSRHRTEELVTLEEVRFLLSHGHEHGVKSGYESYIRYGARHKAKVLLAGHTHVPCIWEDRGILLMNPGSVGNGAHPSYGVIEVEAGQVKDCKIKRIKNPVYEW